MKEIKVSDQDILHLSLLRENVTNFIKKCAEKFDHDNYLLLDVAPQDHNGAKEFFKRTTIRTLDIDENSNANYIADLCQNNSNIIPNNLFDVVICTEVLEHTLNPFDAVKEIKRILKPNGIVCVSVPFNFRIHGPLPDCWRFTEHGLRALFISFEICELRALETQSRDLMPIHYTLIAKKKV
ncbi:methyltransferase domain-containing protein [Flavobacterium faecale]|uniref:methyltransferase domain-containing protein n=1 Tax=Flavobacterium faecale TaxID=1355330 RepID=UPI003AADD2D2